VLSGVPKNKCPLHRALTNALILASAVRSADMMGDKVQDRFRAYDTSSLPWRGLKWTLVKAGAGVALSAPVSECADSPFTSDANKREHAAAWFAWQRAGGPPRWPHR